VSQQGKDEFCTLFDLTQRVPDVVLDDALQHGRLVCVDVGPDSVKAESSTTRMLDTVAQALAESTTSTLPVRICIPALGSPGWGDLTPHVGFT
jgi:elongator complex protein 4